MFDEPVITIIFRLINFVALIGFFYYIFKKYLLPAVQSDIYNHEQEIEARNTSIAQLEGRNKQLSEQLLDQENLCQHLMDRVKQWRTTFEHELNRKKQDRDDLHNKTVARLKKQQNMITHAKIMNIVVAKALEKAKQEEIKYFSNDSSHASYIRDLITHIQQS